MEAPFDIAADLDTPVSAYLKLRPFAPRFLLESVEKGTHLARYSFLGFGDALEFRLDEQGMRYADKELPRPQDQNELLAALRDAQELAPNLAELVFAAGAGDALVGVSAYSEYPPAVEALPLVGDVVVAIDQDGAAGVPDDAADDINQRRLAGTVRPEQSKDLALVDLDGAERGVAGHVDRGHGDRE